MVQEFGELWGTSKALYKYRPFTIREELIILIIDYFNNIVGIANLTCLNTYCMIGEIRIMLP